MSTGGKPIAPALRSQIRPIKRFWRNRADLNRVAFGPDDAVPCHRDRGSAKDGHCFDRIAVNRVRMAEERIACQRDRRCRQALTDEASRAPSCGPFRMGLRTRPSIPTSWFEQPRSTHGATYGFHKAGLSARSGRRACEAESSRPRRGGALPDCGQDLDHHNQRSGRPCPEGQRDVHDAQERHELPVCAGGCRAGSARSRSAC